MILFLPRFLFFRLLPNLLDDLLPQSERIDHTRMAKENFTILTNEQSEGQSSIPRGINDFCQILSISLEKVIVCRSFFLHPEMVLSGAKAHNEFSLGTVTPCLCHQRNRG